MMDVIKIIGILITAILAGIVAIILILFVAFSLDEGLLDHIVEMEEMEDE
ncbi:MAG: hypothetical protein ACI4LC_05990 [Emergencia sp.]